MVKGLSPEDGQKFGASHPLKGLCHQKNIFEGLLLKIGTFCTWADGFKSFGFFVAERIKFKVLACSFEITY